MKEVLLAVVMLAYADCNMANEEEGYKKRNLKFRAEEDCSPEEAKEIMLKACPDGYNNFTASIFEDFPADCRITLAREGSPAVYVKRGSSELPEANDVSADECDQENGFTRYWWD